MTGVIKAKFKMDKRGKYVETMGTGSLFQYKLLDDWAGAVKEAEEKAKEYNEKLKKLLDLEKAYG